MVFNSHWIEPTFFGFVVTGGGFFSYYNLQCIKLDKRIKNLRKKSVLTQFLKWVQSRVGFNFTPTI